MGTTDSLQKAVKKLLDAGVLIEQDAFELLRTVPDPFTFINNLLQNAGKIEVLSRERMLHFTTLVQRKVPEKKISPSGKVPRRHRRREETVTATSAPVISPPVEKQPVTKRYRPGLDNNGSLIRTSLDDLQGLHDYQPDIRVVRDSELSGEYLGTVDDLHGYFQDRFARLSTMFRRRLDIGNITRIKDIRPTNERISVIGMLTEKNLTGDGGNIILEDPSSEQDLKVIIPKKNKDLISQALQIMDDTVICVDVNIFKGNFIANDLLLPDIPNLTEKHRADIPVHVAFLSDIHVGSHNFLDDPMERFIEFINGRYGNKKMRALGEQTKYVMFGGDIVDGIGIYPGQLNDLSIEGIRDQYEAFAGYVERMPEDVQVVIIPGNHDMVRNAEPQPKIPEEYTQSLYRKENVHMLGNPSQVALHSVEVLLYHCTSMPDIMNHIPGIPNDKPVEVMKHMLRARHLAPLWGSKTPIAAEPKDHLVIEHIPDIFHGGHIHINGEGAYRGVQIVNSGTMQSQTSFQKSLNIIPTPGQITVTNLKDLKINKLDFMSKS